MPRITEIVYINLGDAPRDPEIDVIVVVDDSGSMAAVSQQVQASLRDFIEHFPFTARVGLVSFGNETRVLCAPTDCREFLLDQVGRFEGSSGGTALFDAVGDSVGLFETSPRQRAVVVLTDGGECSSTRNTARSITDSLLAQGVRFFAIGIGSEVQEEPLQHLADATGGAYVRAGSWADLAAALTSVTCGIEDGLIRLRPEFTRLSTRGAERNEWLQQLSVDAWEEDDVRTLDETHVRCPGALDGEALAKVRAACRALMRSHLEKSSSATALADPDITLVLTGWIDDPLFTHLSPLLSADFREVAGALGLTRTIYPVHVALVHRLNEADETTKRTAWAWLTAVHNLEGTLRPKVILSCGDRNRHSSRNQTGFQLVSRETVIHAAADLFWTIADEPQLLNQAASFKTPLAASGAASLASPSDLTKRNLTASALEARLAGFCDLQAQIDPAVVHRAEEDFGRWMLDATSVASELNGLIDKSHLSDFRLDPTSFWPPPRGTDPDQYPSALPGFLEERAAEFLSRRLNLLIQTIQDNAERIVERTRERVEEQVDNVMFGTGSGGVAASLVYLRALRARLEDEARTLTPDTFASEVRKVALFDRRSLKIREATVSPQQALDRVKELIENHPLPEALALRHGSLGFLVGSASYLLFAGIPLFALNLGALHIPWLVGGVAGAATAGLGRYRWVVWRQRLRSAIGEYLIAVEDAAFQRAVTQCVEAARSVYAAVCTAIGESGAIPEWVPPAIRTERDLTEMQHVAGFGEYLTAASAEYRREREIGVRHSNPFVIEFGGEIATQGAGERRIIPASTSEASLDWIEAGRLEPNWYRRWREVLRRKRCDTLAEYLAFHERRVRLPRELRDAAVALLDAELDRAASVGTRWDALDGDLRSAIVKEMTRLAFPTVAVDETVTAHVSVDDAIVANTNELTQIRARNPGVFASAKEQAIAAPDRIHRYSLYRGEAVAELVDWRACRAAWEGLPQSERLSALGRWADSGAIEHWIDPTTSEPLALSMAEMPKMTSEDPLI